VLPPLFRARVKRILPFHGSNVYSLGLDPFEFKPFSLIEDWESTVGDDKNVTLNNTPISLAAFGARKVGEGYVNVVRRIWDEGWRPGIPKEVEDEDMEVSSPRGRNKSRSKNPEKVRSKSPGKKGSRSPRKRKMTDE
jgi:hypothetical protein